MSWLGELFSDSMKGIVDGVGNIVDELHTSDEERAEAKFKLKELETQIKIKAAELDQQLENHITDRWKSDNEHGSWLTKNIRPASLVFLLGIITIMAFADGNVAGFTINHAYVSLFEALAMTAFGGYFVVRTAEKIKGVAK